MRYVEPLWLTAAVFLAGCASVPRADLSADDPGRRAEIQRVLSEIFDAAEKQDLPRLDSHHFYGPKFTKFAAEQAGRQDAAVARQGEHDGLKAVRDLSMRADDLKIDVFGDVGIATFVMSYHFSTGTGTMAKQARSTLVFVKERGEWKIAHEHFSALETEP